MNARDKDGRTPMDLGHELRRMRERPRPRRAADAADYEADETPVVVQPPRRPESNGAAYRVIHESKVAVRAAPSAEAKVVGAKMPGETVRVAEVHEGWAKLSDGGGGANVPPGARWMLIDGRGLGLGQLLERVERMAVDAAEEGNSSSDDD